MTAPGDDDLLWMARAVELAKRGFYTARPNPCVGAVIVQQGKNISEGFHRKAGEAHAEIVALQTLAYPHDAEGATLYVTLEPCCHHGKTPPCTQQIIAAGIKRVVYGMQDPNPLVAGKGLQQLCEAGIDVAGPVMERECRALNPGFIKRMQTGLPYLRCKLAMSLDGRTAMASGESQWITGEAARADVQRLRAQSDAIITGSGTVLHDNPALTVRSDSLPAEAKTKQPLRVILDRQHRVPSSAQLLNDGHVTLVLHNTTDLRAVLKQLGERECNEVLIEAGATLAGAFATQGLIDEYVIYMAPTLLGNSARPLLQLPYDRMDQQQRLHITDITPLGNDWRIVALSVQ